MFNFCDCCGEKIATTMVEMEDEGSFLVCDECFLIGRSPFEYTWLDWIKDPILSHAGLFVVVYLVTRAIIWFISTK